MPLEAVNPQSALYWFITAVSLCAVNVYVLISGYFLTGSEFKPRKLLGLILQVLEYSILILAVLIIIGAVDIADLDPYAWLGYIFPIATGEYWFVTSYLMMYLLSPILAGGARAMDKRTYGIVLAALIIFESVEKSILPQLLPGDRYGYDLIWFITLFLVAAYIRLYGIPFLEKKGRGLLVYIASVILLWGAGLAGSALKLPLALHYADITSHYNHFLVLTASVGLFYVFKGFTPDESGLLSRIAGMLGRLTLGVYLLHEHPGVRDKWQAWLGASGDESVGRVLSGWLVSLIVVYGAGLLVEYIRRLIHDKASAVVIGNKQ